MVHPESLNPWCSESFIRLRLFENDSVLEDVEEQWYEVELGYRFYDLLTTGGL